MDIKKRNPWFLSELDALVWEREQEQKMRKKKEPPTPPPEIPHKYTSQDSEEVRRGFGLALGQINLGDEVAISTTEDTVVVIAVGKDVTQEVVKAVKKVFDQIELYNAMKEREKP